MARVSSHTIDNNTQEELFVEFVRYLMRGNKKSSTQFLRTLLTPTEQLMLAKRTAVIALFHNGASTYAVMKMLHMSSSTVIHMHHRYKKGDYAQITKLFGMGKKERERFFEIIDVIIRAGLPPRCGARWTIFKKLKR